MSHSPNPPPPGIPSPLVSVILSDTGDEKHTRVSYFVGKTMIMDMDILKDVVPLDGPMDPMALTQLFVTPHELLGVLSDVYILATGKETSGPRWDDTISRIGRILGASASPATLVVPPST